MPSPAVYQPRSYTCRAVGPIAMSPSPNVHVVPAPPPKKLTGAGAGSATMPFWMALVGVVVGLAMLAVAGTTLGGPVLMKDKWSPQYLQLALEGVAVIVLVAAVLVLAMGSGIRQDGAVSILSTIGGYVLGRSITTATRAKDSDA